MPRRFEIHAEGLPNLPGMMLATVEALRSLGGSAKIDELDEKVVEIEGVSEFEQSHLMSGDENRLRLNYYLAWARTYLKRGNALENSSRGVWSLTEVGENLKSIEQTQEIYVQVNQEERDRARLKRKQKKAPETPANAEDEVKLGEPDEASDWKQSLLATIRMMKPDAFERLSQRLLREAGFIKVEVRGKSGDGGIDGLGVLRMNLVSFQVYFQCKKWTGSVSAKEVRDFRGALQGRADKGLFITTGRFTSQASDEATRDGAIAIDLIDGDRLCELLKENGLGVSTDLVERVKIDPDWFQSV